MTTSKPEYLTSWTDEEWTSFVREEGTWVNKGNYYVSGGCPIYLTWMGPYGRKRRIKFFPIPGSTVKSSYEELTHEFLALVQLVGPEEIYKKRSSSGCVRWK